MDQSRGDWVGALAERHGRMVFATAYRVLGRADDAEDVLQEVFLRLLNSGNGHSRRNLIKDWGAYLRITALHVAIDLLRRRRVRRRESEPRVEEIAVGEGQDPGDTASLRDQARLLREALSQLPARDAEVFALRYFEEFSYQEISVQMEMNVNQIGVILHRARARLRELVGTIEIDKEG